MKKLKNIIFIFLIFWLIIFIYGCPQKDKNIKENKVEEKKEEQVEQKVEISDLKIEDVDFQNVPSNVDIYKLKQELEEFFINYELVVLSKDFERWLTFLSPKYYQNYNDPEFYKKNNLTIYGITDIKSYFFNVVYQSRVKLNNGQPLKIFKVIFNPQNVNKAKVFVRYEDKILTYYFIKIDGKWKIGLKEEYESD
jgi:hypothetical protein